jgi:hypothetical protein
MTVLVAVVVLREAPLHLQMGLFTLCKWVRQVRQEVQGLVALRGAVTAGQVTIHRTALWGAVAILEYLEAL